MNAFEAFQLYIALKNHFTQKSYDYFKYSGKTSVNLQTFENRRDINLFKKLAKHQDPKNLLIASLIQNPNMWIGDLLSASAEDRYKKYNGFMQALEYNFRTEIGDISNDYNSLFVIEGSNHPAIITLFLRNQISIQTLCILISISGSFKYINKRIDDDIIWSQIGLLITKYSPFMVFDKSKFKLIMKERWIE